MHYCVAAGGGTRDTICIRLARFEGLFRPLGGVKADIVLGQDNRSKGWGTVLFETQEDAEKAIQIHQL